MIAKVVATNVIGDSATSSNSVSNAVLPVWEVSSAPQNVARDEALTSASQVTFTWSVPSYTGGTGTSILDYSIQWDNATGSFSSLTTGVTALTFTKTGVTAGVTYQFKVAARNQVGLSVYTSSFSIVAASVPSAPNAPTTTVDGPETGVVISWNAP